MTTLSERIAGDSEVSVYRAPGLIRSAPQPEKTT